MRKAGGSEVPQLFSKTFIFQPNGGSMSNITLVGNQDHINAYQELKPPNNPTPNEYS